VEGEEESGGDSLKKYVEAEKASLAPDAVVISDTSMHDEQTPTITYSLRGLVGLEATVRVADRDLHSGAYGGAVGNPGLALARMLDACIAPDGRVQVPGFYDEVRPLEDWEKDTMDRLGFDERTVTERTGTPASFGETGHSLLDRIWARPTFEINGLIGGYTGRGIKTIIPACATVKISMRLVPDQEPERVFRLVSEYLKLQCPSFATVEVRGPFSAAPPVLFDVQNPTIELAQQALAFGFGNEPALVRCGGSIPVAGTFWNELKKPVVLMGFSLDSDGAHSANEHFRIESFINGAKTSAHFIDTFAQAG
jgi:acetylornithine deacetylase/succinyl-diaminopimelate desuccinylase-like protein